MWDCLEFFFFSLKISLIHELIFIQHISKQQETCYKLLMENKGQGKKRTAGVMKKRAKDQEEAEGGREGEKRKKPVLVITEHD